MTKTQTAAHVYTQPQTARRAARVALKGAAFEIYPNAGGFSFRAVDTSDAALPPARVEASSPAVVNDIPPGLKRLRKSAAAQTIRAATVADQAAGRAEAAAKLAAQYPTLAQQGAPLGELLADENFQPPAFLATDAAPAINDVAAALAVLKPASAQTGGKRMSKTAATVMAAQKRAAAKATAPAEVVKADVQPKPKADAPKPGTRMRSIFDMLTRPKGATAKEMAAAGVADCSVKVNAEKLADRFGLKISVEKDGKFDRVRLTGAA